MAGDQGGHSHTFGGGLDKMRDAIMEWLHNKEIPIVKLFDWLLPP